MRFTTVFPISIGKDVATCVPSGTSDVSDYYNLERLTPIQRIAYDNTGIASGSFYERAFPRAGNTHESDVGISLSLRLRS
jgi:hypothetical protein